MAGTLSTLSKSSLCCGSIATIDYSKAVWMLSAGALSISSSASTWAIPISSPMLSASERLSPSGTCTLGNSLSNLYCRPQAMRPARVRREGGGTGGRGATLASLEPAYSELRIFYSRIAHLLRLLGMQHRNHSGSLRHLDMVGKRPFQVSWWEKGLMARRQTGPGGKYSIGEGVGLIYNFDHDWHELKPEHVLYIMERIVPTLSRGGGTVELTGLASRIGNADYNRRLGERRADEAWACIRRFTPPQNLVFRRMNPRHEHGEYISKRYGEKDETETVEGRYRGVWINAKPVKYPTVDSITEDRRTLNGNISLYLVALVRERDELRASLVRLENALMAQQQGAVDHGSTMFEPNPEMEAGSTMYEWANSPYFEGHDPGTATISSQTAEMAEQQVEKTKSLIEWTKRRLDVLTREIHQCNANYSQLRDIRENLSGDFDTVPLDIDRLIR